MAVTVRADAMTSDRTAHAARPAPDLERLWEVSWLPGRYLTRDQAITAMVIADAGIPGTLPQGHRAQVYLPGDRPGQSFLVQADMHPGHRAWAHLEHWAAQLGLTAAQALAKVDAPPAWAITQERPVTPADPEAAE